MKTKYKILLGVIGLILISCLFYVLGWFLAPGSYARAEIYELELKEDSLIQIIKEIKTENPELNLTLNVTSNGHVFGLNDGRKDSLDQLYHIYFYYPDKNVIIYTWVSQNTRTTVSFAFVATNHGLDLKNWTPVNNEFWWWRNKSDKVEFEKRILKLVKEKIEERKPNPQ